LKPYVIAFVSAVENIAVTLKQKSYEYRTGRKNETLGLTLDFYNWHLVISASLKDDSFIFI